MFYKLYQRLLHRLHASTRHGIHSPFVYRFIADGLQPPLPIDVQERLPGDIMAKLLYRTLSHALRERLIILGAKEHDRQMIRKICALHSSTPSETLFLPHPPALTALAPDLRNDDLCLVLHPHESPAATADWETLRSAGPVRMSIDLFELGILLFRQEFHVPQHFKLRTYD